MRVQTLNPATESLISEYTYLTPKQIDSLVDEAHIAFTDWRKTEFKHRAFLMKRLSDVLIQRKDDCAKMISAEMGKLLTEATAEIEKCALVCNYYADHAAEFLAPYTEATEMHKSLVCYQPLGIVFGIMPWNYPFWQVFRYAAPTVMAGNVTILKHASICSGSAGMITQLFLEAGFPEHVFQHAIIDATGAAAVIAHEKVCAVTLTGSEGAGTSVASTAGANLKKVVLELGGSDPYVVLADADLHQAAECIVRSRLKNCGQVCIAAKRVIAVQEIADELTAEIVKQMKVYNIGDPLDPNTMLAPMARSDLRDALHHQVQQSQQKGATLHLGGFVPPGQGFYYPATLLTNVNPGMPAFDEELFGPVVSITTAKNEEEAIALANDTKYGLGAAIFTRNLARGEKIAMHDIDAGSCFVNASVSSDPRLPFGGIKRSGFGRELSKQGILAFVNTKTVSIADV